MIAGIHAGRVSGLRSVVISAQRCAALIDGKTILLGEKYGHERLVEIRQDHVVLQGAAGMRTLHLFPAVEMKLNRNPESKAQQPVCSIGAGQGSFRDVGGVKEKK